jgi:preprotein translocase SecE subunit
MATAVQKSSESTTASNPQARLLLASAIGAVYTALALAFVVFGVPYLWKMGVSDWIATHLGSFVDIAGLIIVLVTVAAGLLLGGLAIAGPNPPEGMRAGVFTILAGLLLIFLVSVGVGELLERYLITTQVQQTLGLAITVALAVGLIVAAVIYSMKPQFAKFLVAFEGQGWFRAKAYKPSQGRLVRRLTIAGILVLAATGIWTLVSHKVLERPSPYTPGHEEDWTVHIPFTAKKFVTLPQDLRVAPDLATARYVRLLPDVAYTVPLLLSVLGLWIGWRAANYPTFADFLIATEAEMNKVSWTTRRRLVQDTIVVLVTVVLFCVFLLLVDQLWGWVLTRETLGGIVPKAKTIDKSAAGEAKERDY